MKTDSDLAGATLVDAGGRPGLLSPGTRLARRYEIERLIGEGGMGAVYRATDQRLKRIVAVKTLASVVSGEAARGRFEREAQAASAIRHLNVVDVFDYGLEGDLPFIVMEYLRGEDLSQILSREGRLSPARAVDLTLGICAGVYAAHEAGVIHRDLKPPNVFVVAAGAGDIVKVLDFGVSKVAALEASITAGGDIVGTIEYMSPEQAGGQAVDGRSDQYAVGVILYRALAGRVPYRGDDTFSTLRLIAGGAVTPPRAFVPELDLSLQEVVLRAMAQRREERFASVNELGRALLPLASERGRRQWTDTFVTSSPNALVSRPWNRARGVVRPSRVTPLETPSRGPTALDRRMPGIARTKLLAAARDAPSLPPTRTRPPRDESPAAAPAEEPVKSSRVTGLVWLVAAGALVALAFQLTRSLGSRDRPVSLPASLEESAAQRPHPPPRPPEPEPAPFRQSAAPPEASAETVPAPERQRPSRRRRPPSNSGGLEAEIKFTPNGVPILR